MSTTTISLPGTTTPNGGASIRVRDLWKVYGPGAARYLDALRSGAEDERPGCTSAVRGVSFEVEPGETFVVMGLSGSGKSTLVRCLTRLVEPTGGEVEVDGVDVLKLTRRQLSETRRTDWAMVFQHFGLLPHRRVLQNVAYGLEVSGVGRRERDARARELIELVGLRGVEDKFPHELSGGMKQRVGLARALVMDPRLLLLDEPFSALDPLIRADLQDQLLRLAKVVKQTAVFITHDLAEALKVGDRIAIMRDGQFVQVGTPEEIVLHPKDDYVRRFALEAPRSKVVTAGTAASPSPVLTGTESVDVALAAMSATGVTTAIVDGRLPFTVTADQLRSARPGGDLSEVAAGDFAVVGDAAKLSVVMSELVRTNNTVIVRNEANEFIGTIDNASVVRALGVPLQAADSRLETPTSL